MPRRPTEGLTWRDLGVYVVTMGALAAVITFLMVALTALVEQVQ